MWQLVGRVEAFSIEAGMSDEITVIVIDRGRKNLYLRYTDPVTGQDVEKSSRTSNKREATKRAGEWQAELRAGIATKKSNLRWDAFTEAYHDHVVATLRPKTAEKVLNTFNVITDTMKPDKLGRITSQWIDRFQKRLLKLGRADATVASHCRHLKAAMNWAKDRSYIATVPKFPPMKKARSAKVMKGRPITGEEFERMLLAIQKLPERQQESIEFLLRGLWLSGLRLGEALSLTWDMWSDGIRVDTSGKHIVLLIPAEEEKGGQDRTYAVTPDFGEFLRSVPKSERTGFVFNPELHRGVSRRIDSVSKTIVKLGQLAQIKVDQKGDKITWASAHDLRRAFGFRWAPRVMPMDLKELMRHASVQTTEKYYVAINAQSTAERLHMLQRDTLRDTHEKTDPEEAESVRKNL